MTPGIERQVLGHHERRRPAREMRSTMSSRPSGTPPPGRSPTASPTRPPLCGSECRCSCRRPRLRVSAVKGTKVRPDSWISRHRRSYLCLARTTMDRPSGVSSESEVSWAASARSRSLPAARGGEERHGHAISQRDRPVLSSSRVSHVAGRLDGPARSWLGRCTGPGGPCRRCRWPTAGRRWWWG